MPVLDQNDYIVVLDRHGVKRTVVGPCVFKPTYGETWSDTKEAITLQINEFVMIKNGAEVEKPIRYIPSPSSVLSILTFCVE